MNYTICIPSYHRSEIFKNYTYKMLIEDKVDLNRVIVFLQDKDDIEKYQAIDDNLNIEILNAVGLAPALCEIHRRFEEDENIVILHDDMIRFYTLIYSKKDIESGKVSRKEFGKARKRRRLDWVINEVFENMKQYSYGGVSIMSNPYFLGNNVSYDLRLIEGCFSCIKNKKDICCSITSFQDDVERILKFYDKEGGTCRVNYIGYEYMPLTNKKGLGGQSVDIKKRKEIVKKEVEKWCRLYPKYGKMVPNKKEGFTFKLKRIPK